MSVISTFERWEQEDSELNVILGYFAEFKPSLGYMSSCLRSKNEKI